jgi:hypothetical protein
MVSALDDLGVKEFVDLQMVLEDADMRAELALKVRKITRLTLCTRGNRRHSLMYSTAFT